MTKDKAKKVLSAITSLPHRDVLVGIPESNSGRDAGEPIANAALLWIHEHGAPEANIPARPSLLPGIRDAQPQITNYLKQAGQAALKGDTARVDRVLHAVGLTAVNSVRRKIQMGPFIPLAPATIAARQARGRTGTKPLLDTGQMRNAITYVLRDKGRV